MSDLRDLEYAEDADPAKRGHGGGRGARQNLPRVRAYLPERMCGVSVSASVRVSVCVCLEVVKVVVSMCVQVCVCVCVCLVVRCGCRCACARVCAELDG